MGKIKDKKTMRVVLPLPVSLNSMYSQSRSGHRFKTQEAKDWEEKAGYKLMKAKKYGKAKVEVFITYYFSRRGCDLSNPTKILLDLLQKMQIVDNDSQIYILHEYKKYDKRNPRTEIIVDKLEE